MKLNKVTLENFLTYESLEYIIPRTPLLVQGKNLTEEDQESNGSGKSGIFTAIEFCIAGTNSRGVKDKELVMFGQKEARATLEASCDVRKELILIDWTIKVKGSNILQISKKAYGQEEWTKVSFSNVNDGKKYITDWFAIDKEDLFNYYIINKQRFKSFFKASNKEKVDLINRFSDASIIDGLDNIDNTELQVELEDLKSEVDRVQGKIELIEEQIESATDIEAQEELSKRLKEEEDVLKRAILSLCIEQEEMKGEIKEIETDLKPAQSRLDSIQVKIDKAEKIVDDFKLEDYTEQIEDLEEEETELSGKDNKVARLIKQLTVELNGAVTCPSCNHEFCVDSKHGTLEEVKDKLGKAEGLEEQISIKLEKISETIGQLEVKDRKQKNKKIELQQKNADLYKEHQAASKAVLSLERELAEVKAELKESMLEADAKRVQKYNKSLEVLASLSPPDTAELNNQLTKLKKDKIKLDKDLEAKGDEIYERNKWKNNFKAFRLHLANQSLEAIEYHKNRYLAEMGSDLQVKMEGFKMLSNGTFKDEITAHIVRNATERSFSSFSGGEQGRLLFASILANRHMLNSTHKYGGLDFLSVDEVFEGVDSLGLKSLVKSAKLLDIAVMIITHVTDENVNDDVLLIVKENGISSIYRN